MSSPPFQSLQAVNRHLGARLSRLSGELNLPAVIVPTEFADLLAELQRATQCLRSLPAAAPDAEMVSEISEYRSNVERL
jgi:hypothetical protein